jgi:type IV secretory pathway TrbL component
MNKKLLASVLNVLVLCIVIFFVSTFFVYQTKIIGYILIILSFVCIASLKLFRVHIPSIKPDIIFGVIDNGILALMAVIGGEIAGVAGAVIGGVVGNAITDGIAGLFEGYWAETIPEDKRTVAGSAVGKMAGCLLGAGIVLVLAGFVGHTL